jgi:Fe-S-cluster containining protein
MDLAEALDAWNGTPRVEIDALPAHIQTRIPESRVHATAAMEKVGQKGIHHAISLIDVAAKSTTSAKRVLWLQKAGDALSAAYGSVSACKAGCAHCCHISVLITEAEAVQIGRAIGRRPAKLHEPIDEVAIEGYESPCPMLGPDQLCTIYKHRPAVCRGHMNMDRDDLLCQLIPGSPVPVPYLDPRLLALGTATVLGAHQVRADIRQWFPTRKAQ